MKKIDSDFYRKSLDNIEKMIPDNDKVTIENKKLAINVGKIAASVFVSMYNQLVDDGYLDK